MLSGVRIQSEIGVLGVFRLYRRLRTRNERWRLAQQSPSRNAYAKRPMSFQFVMTNAVGGGLSGELMGVTTVVAVQ